MKTITTKLSTVKLLHFDNKVKVHPNGPEFVAGSREFKEFLAAVIAEGVINIEED
jgi:hypothetical protein